METLPSIRESKGIYVRTYTARGQMYHPILPKNEGLVYCNTPQKRVFRSFRNRKSITSENLALQLSDIHYLLKEYFELHLEKASSGGQILKKPVRRF